MTIKRFFLWRNDSAADGRSRREPLSQRRGVALTHHTQEKPLNIVSIMFERRLHALRRSGKFFACVFLFLPENKLRLFLLMDANISEVQLFIIEDIVHGAKHL